MTNLEMNIVPFALAVVVGDIHLDTHAQLVRRSLPSSCRLEINLASLPQSLKLGVSCFRTSKAQYDQLSALQMSAVLCS